MPAELEIQRHPRPVVTLDGRDLMDPRPWEERFEDEEPPAPSLRRPVTIGIAALLVGLGGFGGWAFSAQLESAAVATATVIVDSKRKTVSHFEGGILKRLLVQEGDSVKVGDALLLLDDTRAKADLQQLEARRIGLEAKLVRLRAEQAGEAELVFPAAFQTSTNPIVTDVIAAEQRFFKARRAMLDRKIDIQRKTIEQQSAELAATDAQMAVNRRQKELLNRELTAISGLVEKGFARRPDLTELQNRESQLEGTTSELVARRAKAEQAKAAAELQILSAETDFQQQVAGDLQAAQLDLADTLERITSARDVLRRLKVDSPQDGIVTDIRMRTPGSAISAGQPILDIVPEHEPLIIEAKVGLRDIDSVHVGAPVQVRLTAYNLRTTAPLAGRLSYVSADQQVNQQDGSAFYVARAEILPESIAANPGIKLYPGMPAEILIINKPRRAIDYLVDPIVESFNRAFREE